MTAVELRTLDGRLVGKSNLCGEPWAWWGRVVAGAKAGAKRMGVVLKIVKVR